MQAPQQIQSASVYRPAWFDAAPEFAAEVTESVANRYRMKVDALSASTKRMSFSVRSPGVSVFLSPNAFVECSFDVTFAGRNTFRTQTGPVVQRLNTENIEAQNADAVAQPNAKILGFASKVCFGSSDAFGSALTNFQLVVNGASISNSRQNTYKTTLEKCWYTPQFFQRNFSQAGGCPDAYDTVAVSGLAHLHGAGNVNGQSDGIINAYTADSGIQKRCQNFIAATVALPAAAVAAGDKRRIRVRWPVNGVGIFSAGQVGIDQMSDSCPQRRSCMALPHMNILTIDLLFDDLEECLFRNLSSRTAGANNTILANDSSHGVRVSLVPDSTELHLEYLRFGLWRQLRDSYNLQVYRISVTDASSQEATGCMRIPAALTRSTVNRNLDNAMPCIGVDRGEGSIHALNAAFSGQKYLEAKWTGVVTAQCPSYLAWCLQKSSKQYVLGGNAADDGIGKQVQNMQGHDVNGTLTLQAGAPANGQVGGCETYFLSRNTDSSASIQQFSLEIQSSSGAYVYSSEAAPFLRSKAELFRDHYRSCVNGYLDGDINKWSTHACILLLGADSFIRGLTTDGVAYPLSINCTVKFASQRQYIDGTAAVGLSVAAANKGIAIQQDVIQGQPVMLQIYPKSRMTISPSSALLASQNMSHASGLDLIGRKAS